MKYLIPLVLVASALSGCMTRAQHRKDMAEMQAAMNEDFCTALISTKIRCAVAMKSSKISVPGECMTVWENMLHGQNEAK